MFNRLKSYLNNFSVQSYLGGRIRMTPRVLKVNIYTFLLVLLCSFHLIGNIYWLILDKSPFPWDQAGHTIIAFKFTDFLNGSDRSQDFLSISDYYPPFVHLLVALFMLVFGKNILIGPLMVTGFFILGLVFLYLYAYQLFKNRLTAFLSATIFSFLPNIYALSREFLLEIPLVTMVLSSLFFLEKSDNFHNKKNTILFSYLLALALSIKWTALVFIFIPVIFKLKKMLPLIEWKNLSLSLIIVLLINLPWYMNNLPIILYAAKITATPEVSDPQTIISYESFKYYLFMMTNFQMTWLGMLVFIISLIYFILKKRHQSLFLLLTFLFIYLVFTLIGNKDLRYIIFLAPVATMIMAFFLTDLSNKQSLILRNKQSLILRNKQSLILRNKQSLILRNKTSALTLTAVLFLYYLFYFFSLSFGILISPAKIDFRRSIQIPLFGWVDLINLGKYTSSFLAPAYDQTVWPNSIIAEELNRHNLKKSIKVLVISEKPYLNQVNLELARKQLNFKKVQFYAPYNIAPFTSNQLLEKYLLGFDIILLADKDLGPEGGIRPIIALKQMSKFLKENQSQKIIKINTYPLPDLDQLIVYKPREDIP
ncbi:glycosyltransferase family 39 protein [Candidatus Daviesbacteria bacterium]|nr:glycosyltransferase family 39 protein [Candidatus Daviesbacteria bacterium]